MIDKVRRQIRLLDNDLPDVELTGEEFEAWVSNPTTMKVMEILFHHRQRYSAELSEGASLGDHTERETAQYVGLIAGIDMLLRMEYEAQDERGEDESEDTRDDND